MSTRNGKIARLPGEIRDELNERLEQAEEGPELLAWLNGLAEVQEMLAEKFAGVPVSKQNLSEWRQGGFQEWLVRQDVWEHVRDTGSFARDLDGARDNVVADDVATVLAARYAALISKWDGEVDEKFEAKTRVLNSLSRGIVQLQRGLHRSKKDNDDFERRLEEDDQRLKEEIKSKKLDQMYSYLKEPQVAEVFGGGTLGRQIAKYIIQVENDVPGATLRLPKNDKPTRQKKKTPPTKRHPSPPQSNPVKPSQSDSSASIPPIPPAKSTLDIPPANGDYTPRNPPGCESIKV